MIKATKVDGVYDMDPNQYAEAQKFDHLTYIETLNRRLEVMDSTAISLCMENKLPILVLNLWDEEALPKALRGEKVGTLVNEGWAFDFLINTAEKLTEDILQLSTLDQ